MPRYTQSKPEERRSAAEGETPGRDYSARNIPARGPFPMAVQLNKSGHGIRVTDARIAESLFAKSIRYLVLIGADMRENRFVDDRRRIDSFPFAGVRQAIEQLAALGVSEAEARLIVKEAARRTVVARKSIFTPSQPSPAVSKVEP